MSIEDLLKKMKSEIEKMNPVPTKYLISQGNNNGFEKLVPKVISQIIKENNLSEYIKFKAQYGHHFPDITVVINNLQYGIELKSRKDGSWKTNGNSVIESISPEKYEEIFLFFGSKDPKDNRILIKYAPYWQVTATINVTHSPRFEIDMNTNQSVFESRNKYNQLRNMNLSKKIKFIQDYLKENTSGPKWYVSPSDGVSPILINEINSSVKSQRISECLVLYPQDLIRKGKCHRAHYERITKYLLETYFMYSSSLRDLFSASGKWPYCGVEFPKIIKTFRDHRTQILSILHSANDEFKKKAYKSWSEVTTKPVSKDFKNDFFFIINTLGKDAIYNKYLDMTCYKCLTDLIFHQ